MGGQYTFDGTAWEKDGLPVRSVAIQPCATVPIAIAREAHKEYVNRYGTGQTLSRICERGGFGGAELAILLYDRVKHLERRIYQLRGQQRG